MDEEQGQRGYLLRMTTEELEKVRAQMRGLEEELTKVWECVAFMANMGQNTTVDTEPVEESDGQNANPEPQPRPEPATIALETSTEQGQELVALREELAAQEALRGKEREQKKIAEEKRRRVEESSK